MSQTAITPASKAPWLHPVGGELRVLLVHNSSHGADHILQRLTQLHHRPCLIKSWTHTAEAAASLATEDYTLIFLVAAASLQETFRQFDRLADCAADTPVVVLCQSGDESFIQEIIEHGATDCLEVSSIDDQTLRRVVRFAETSKRTQQHIAWLKNFDAVTELPNRDRLRAHLSEAIVRARHNDSLFSVLMLNLDRFKLINETLGQSRGDLLLQEIGTRLRSSLPTSDLLARHNGDEFVVVSHGLSVPEDATLIAQKMLNALSRPIMIEGHEVFITGSIGISVFPGDGADADVLISNADAAVSRAKDMGRNHFQFYTMDMDAKTTRRLSLESELRRALDRGEFLLHYQPQFDLAGQRITGFEALVRWQHPKLGLVPPNDFIPLAEETGLIAPLGEWVLQEACAQAVTWHANGHPNLRIAVNLSSRQFFQENVLDTVTRALNKTHLPPGCLELELTESCVMMNPDEAITTLRQIRDMGIRLAIDDFGTGHSSLNHLKRFPVDCLKIDRSFVNDVTANSEDGAIVQAIIAMAHSLKLQVVAEGVETIEQLRLLESYNCDMIQGYLLSRPLTAEQITLTFLPRIGQSPDVLPFGLAAAGRSPTRS